MTTTAPLNSYISTTLSGQSYFDCGNTSQLSFGGFLPYTFEAWIKPSSVGGMNTIIGRFNGGVAAEYCFGIQDGLVQSYRNVGPWVINSQTVLQAGQWYHVATTYDGQTLSIYVNGLLESSSPFTSQPGFPQLNTLIGARFGNGVATNFFQGELYEVRVWNVCRSAADIFTHMDVIDLTNPALVADYDFNQMPARDVSYNNHPLTPINNPEFVLETSSLQLGGSDYVDCSADTSLSFGGFLPYTFEGWIKLTGPTTGGTILSRFNGGVAAEYSFGVDGNGKVVSYRNVGPWQLASSASLIPEQWNHVATTYNGTTLCIYINGQLDGQLAFTSQPGFPTLNTLLGARFDHGVVSDFFHGSIQNLRIWRTALNADDIVEAMSFPVNSRVLLSANFDFSVAPASDLTGNITMASSAGAIIVEQASPITGLLQGINALDNVEPQLLAAIQKPDETALSEDYINGLVAHAADTIPADTTQHERDAKIAAYRNLLDDVVARVRADASKVGPHTVVEQDGKNFQFHYYSDGVRKNTFSATSDNVDPMTIWLFTFIFTLVSGFFDLILSIQFNTTAMGYIWKQMQRNQAVMAAIAACTTVAVSVDTVLGVLRPMYSAGLLKMALRLVLTWWNLVSAMWGVVTWLAPGYKAYDLTFKMTVLVVKLHVLVAEMPKQIKAREAEMLAA